jgi:hypothetical protein
VRVRVPAKGEPAPAEVVVAGIEFHIASARTQSFRHFVQRFWLFRHCPDLAHQHVRSHLGLGLGYGYGVPEAHREEDRG